MAYASNFFFFRGPRAGARGKNCVSTNHRPLERGNYCQRRFRGMKPFRLSFLLVAETFLRQVLEGTPRHDALKDKLRKYSTG